MALVLGERCEEVWFIRCQYCGNYVATLPHSEILDFIMWLSTRGEIVSCFDCDTIGADVVPDILLEGWNGDKGYDNLKSM